MKRLRVWAPKLTARRPVRARRAVGRDEPFEPLPGRTPHRWLVIGSAVLGVLVACELVYGIAVLAS